MNKLDQYKSFLKRLNVIEDLSKKYNVTPDEVTDFLFEIGFMALKKTEKILSEDFRVNSKKLMRFYKEFSEVWEEIDLKIKSYRK